MILRKKIKINFKLPIQLYSVLMYTLRVLIYFSLKTIKCRTIKYHILINYINESKIINVISKWINDFYLAFYILGEHKKYIRLIFSYLSVWDYFKFWSFVFAITVMISHMVQSVSYRNIFHLYFTSVTREMNLLSK